MAQSTRPLGAWAQPLVVTNTTVHSESRLSSRMRETAAGKSALSSMLIFVRGKPKEDLERLVKDALVSATSMSRDYRPNVWIPMRCNGDAAQLISDYDTSISLLLRIFRLYEIPSFKEIDDPKINWLSKILRDEFGAGWCGDGSTLRTDFWETKRKDIIERMAGLSKHWIKARVSDARSDSRIA